MQEIFSKIVDKIKSKYPDLFVQCDYLKESDIYEVWYNKECLDQDDDFTLFIGEIIRDYLIPNNIFNVFFSYNYEKTNKLNLVKHITYDFFQQDFYIKPMYDKSFFLKKNICQKTSLYLKPLKYGDKFL